MRCRLGGWNAGEQVCVATFSRSASPAHPLSMKNSLGFLFLALVLLLAGCETRSISDSGYRTRRGWSPDANRFYRGELSEFDILGVAPKQEATEENIRRALAQAAPPRLSPGDRVMLIQSGAIAPDAEMMEPMSKYFSLAPFSGVPPEDKEGLPASLRLRAAQGGYRYLVCYWGTLESARENGEGKIVSWVPIVGAFVPDERQRMRINLRAIIVDVASGSWRMVAPAASEDSSYNMRHNRAASDQELVTVLKQRGYAALVAALTTN